MNYTKTVCAAARVFLEEISLHSPSSTYMDSETHQDVCGSCGAYFISENNQADKAIERFKAILSMCEEI